MCFRSARSYLFARFTQKHTQNFICPIDDFFLPETLILTCHVNNRIGPIFLSVCPSVGLSLWELRCAPPQGYRTTLCTNDPCCAPPTCVVHHGTYVDNEPMIHRLCTRTQMYNTYSIFVVNNEHANQGSLCSSVPTNTFVVHNVALYQ